MEQRCIPFKMTINGQEIEAYIPEKSWDEAIKLLESDKKKTGYERAELNERFYSVRANDSIFCPFENHAEDHIQLYDIANYYSSETVAENNARADKLMRQLRRFSVEHRSSTMTRNECMYSITYRILDNNVKLCPNKMINCHYMDIWFDTEDATWQAINLFYSELIWYFTEYKDSL